MEIWTIHISANGLTEKNSIDEVSIDVGFWW